MSSRQITKIRATHLPEMMGDKTRMEKGTTMMKITKRNQNAVILYNNKYLLTLHLSK